LATNLLYCAGSTTWGRDLRNLLESME
jgi:hypothetical protein